MPRMIWFEEDDTNNEFTGEFPVATEEELLEFANKMRAAGEADPIEALIPSVPKEAEECLIANALNFSCTITGMLGCEHLRGTNGYRYVWGMTLPYNATREQAEALSKATGVPIQETGMGWLKLGPLPPHIGNAADAFDMGLAFQEFAREED